MIVIVPENKWRSVSDLLFVDGHYIPGVLDVNTSWGKPFKVTFESNEDAEVFKDFLKEKTHGNIPELCR